MNNFAEHQRHYRQNHTTLGCRLTHMVGVPMIALSLPFMLFKRKLGLAMFLGGWIFQFVGHFVFEKNRPVLMKDPSNPLTYLSALLFVGDEWVRLFRGERLVDDEYGYRRTREQAEAQASKADGEHEAPRLLSRLNDQANSANAPESHLAEDSEVTVDG